MAVRKIVPAEDAIALIRDGDMLACSGYGGNGVPEQLLVTLEKRFVETGEPRDLGLVYAGGQGDGKTLGLNRLGHEGLLSRVIGGHYGLVPAIAKLAVENKIAAYNLPEGVITHLYRDIAAGKPGTLSTVGLGTFVDPRIEGGKVNDAAEEDLVEVVTLAGRESLFYKAFPITVAFVRGTTADPDGNVTMEKESLRLETLAIASAVRNSGGIVICQVERIAEPGSLDARQVRIPGILVDCVVVAEPDHHMQNYGTRHNPALSGEIRVPLESLAVLPLDDKKVAARRAALELRPNTVVNLGIGLPDLVGNVANEERIQDLITLTVDPGVIGGVPLGGLDFGASANFSAMIEHPSQFDFIDGGGLDCAVLGFAECDRAGNVNASRFAGRISGWSGFINITQGSKKIVFLGTFSSGGLKTEVAEGRLSIVEEGRFPKFVEAVSQLTFNGPRAAEDDRDVFYVTERCVFQLTADGLALVEVAPGIDVERDVLARMPFAPITDRVATMESALFEPSPIGLRARMLDIRIEDRLSYDAEANTVFMNYAGMRVRDRADIDRIIAAVDALLEPLRKKVYAIINYDSFEADPEIMDAYLDAVRYVEKRYYLGVSRYTTSGFMRLKLGKGLAKRQISSAVCDSRRQARAHIDHGEAE